MSVNEVKLKRVDDAKLFTIKGTGPATNRTFAIGNEDHTLGNALRHVSYLLPYTDIFNYNIYPYSLRFFVFPTDSDTEFESRICWLFCSSPL